MIIKKMDSRVEQIEELSSLLKGDLTYIQRSQIEKELRRLTNGVLGEKDAAYYIDFHFGNSKYWAVIHDLRLEYLNQVAQIDHILMNRFFDIYVLESKSYSSGVRITRSGEFEVRDGSGYFGIPSPIEQNKRHIHVLERLISAREILPRRIGMPIRPRFTSLILVSPKSIISRPPEKDFDTSMVIKVDALRTKIDKVIDRQPILSDIAAIGKFCSSSTLAEAASRLAAFHRPKRKAFGARFGLPHGHPAGPGQRPVQWHEKSGTGSAPEHICSKCGKAITDGMAEFCRRNAARFGGKAYCMDCQKSFSPGYGSNAVK
jgi:hypothetical protein